MNFFNNYPVLYPWPQILRKSGLSLPYKPREVWWRDWIRKMGLEPGRKVLEVGCGRGFFLDRLAGELKVQASGIDAATLAIEEAKKESVYQDLQVADACKLPFKDGSFDSVLSFDTLEHIENQKQVVLEMVRVLKPGGKILIYTINSNQSFTWNWLISKLGVDIYKNVDHDPKLLVSPDWLKKELEKSGVIDQETDYFDAFISLMVNEAIMVFLSLWQKTLGWEKTENFGRIILKLLSIVSIFMTPILKILDLPWTVFGYSNGFLILGEKR